MSFHVVLVSIHLLYHHHYWLEFSAFVCHSRCTNIIRILILFICRFLSLRMLLRLCLITSSSSPTPLKFFCICLHFLFIFPVVISIIITIYFIWTHCVFSQFHLIFFIPIIIVTFQMVVVIVVESSWYLSKPSSPSTSFKFFCICLAFS